MKILVVEDEKEISNIIKLYLEKDNFEVTRIFDGNEVVSNVAAHNYDLIVLDLMLPNQSGEEILTEIRKFSNVPIIILTAKITESNIINGLNIGADEYMTKPFSAKELVVRVKSLLRRVYDYKDNQNLDFYEDSTIKIDFIKMNVMYKNKKIDLTANEFKVFETLVKNKDVILTRDQIIDNVFKNYFDCYDRNIDTYIKNIRNKICKNCVKTVYSVGYKFVEVSYEDK